MKSSEKCVLVTGANGFVGKNLVARLRTEGQLKVVTVGRKDCLEKAIDCIDALHAVIHLAGENRPASEKDFHTGNSKYTQTLCRLLQRRDERVPVLFTSSIQAELDNPYGRSKRAAEDHLQAHARSTGAAVFLYRLPNVFGKWCKPDYNSVVATYCVNLMEGKPLRVDNPDRVLRLVYIDDVVDNFLAILQDLTMARGNQQASTVVESNADELEFARYMSIEPEYKISLQQLAATLSDFQRARHEYRVCDTGSDLIRSLHATWLSYLPTGCFKYALVENADPRGRFAEFVKTPDAGQVSYFSAHPGVTRGGHYHHTKSEKFLVVQGQARFRFRHMDTGETYDLAVDGANLEVVETVPGWAHDITNTGTDTLAVILWASEVFDCGRPDTYQVPMNL